MTLIPIAAKPKVSGREARRQLIVQAAHVEAALTNEELTRQRVEQCEEAFKYLAAIIGRGFWGRLSWLVLGR